MVNEFDGMKGELGDKHWCDNIPLHVSYVDKWRIVVQTKTFQPLFRGVLGFTKCTTLIHYPKEKLFIKLVVYMWFSVPYSYFFYSSSHAISKKLYLIFYLCLCCFFNRFLMRELVPLEVGATTSLST